MKDKELLGAVPDPGASPPPDAGKMSGDHSEDNLNMVGKRDTEIDDPNDPFELDN